MKFAQKIVLGTSLILAICFSAGGTYMINQNYQVAYDNEVTSNTSQHVMNRYSLESNIVNSMENGHPYGEDMVVSFAAKIDSYGKNQKDMMLINGNDQVVYSNMGELTEELQDYLKDYSGDYYVYETVDSHKMVIASAIKINDEKLILLNRYDITSVYEERNRQLSVFLKIDIAIVLISILLTYLLSNLLTKQIKRLKEISGQIAQGDYSQRTNIESNDEIGQFSKNFDIMAEAVEARVDDLSHEVKTREEFVADFSHELSTPMTSIMGYSKLLLENDEDVELRQKGLHYINSQCRRLENLSGRMMELMGLSKKELTMQWTETEYIIQQLEEVLSKDLREKELMTDVEKAKIFCNGQLMVTLLRNLLENAHRACQKTQQPNISLKGELVASGYRFQIIDNGCGIDKEEIDKLTRAFYRVDKARSRNEGGNGLGLSICNKICVAHGTQLNIESSIGKGSNFSFTLDPSIVEKTGGWEVEE